MNPKLRKLQLSVKFWLLSMYLMGLSQGASNCVTVTVTLWMSKVLSDHSHFDVFVNAYVPKRPFRFVEISFFTGLCANLNRLNTPLLCNWKW